MKNLYQKFTLSTLIISLIISLSACGKKNNEISDYGTESIATGEDADNDTLKANEFGTLSDKLETDKINWEESFEAGGVKFNVKLDYEVPEIDSVPIYTITTVADMDKREQEVVDTLFGNDFEEIHKDFIFSENSIYEDDYILYNLIYNSFYQYSGERIDPDLLEEEMSTWNSLGSFEMHTYKGKYENKEYYALFIIDPEKYMFLLQLLPTDIKEFMEDTSISDYNEFYGFEWMDYGADAENNSYNVINDSDNICLDKKDELRKKAGNFINDTLGAFGSVNYLVQVFADSEEEDVELDNVDISNLKENEVFAQIQFKKENGSTYFDGYPLFVDDNINRMYILYDGSDLEAKNEALGQFDYSWWAVAICSKGILYAQLDLDFLYSEPSVNDTPLLSFESIKESLKEQIKEKFDSSECSVSAINYNTLDFVYYPVSNPDKENEFTFVPAWDFSMSPYNIRAVINAVDGSLLYIGYK